MGMFAEPKRAGGARAKEGRHVIAPSPLDSHAPHASPASTQSGSGCACGGGCPRCQARRFLQAKLKVSAPSDVHEQEADRVAEQVMQSADAHAPASELAPSSVLGRKCACPGGATCSSCGEAGGALQLKAVQSSDTSGATVSDDFMRSLGPGEPLDAGARDFFEPRFGYDFGGVRVHSDARSAESAHALNASAYTVGSDVVFGAGEYAPSSRAGRQLLAHELAHVVQQTSAHSRAGAPGVLQRKPTITIGQASSTPPKSKTVRQAERSCPIQCCGRDLGTLHAMPLLYSKGITSNVKAGDPEADGISAALHFIRNESERPPAASPCHCDDFRIIQVLKTTHPTAADRARGDSYVDVQPQRGDKPGMTSPFYGDSALGRRGEHYIPSFFPDAGERVQTTESIYDTPHRTAAQRSANLSHLSWMGEACVTCVKNSGVDRVLGCVTYGFTRRFDAAKNDFDPVVAVGPGCFYGPSNNFVERLANDPLTMRYVFSTPPSAEDCKR